MVHAYVKIMESTWLAWAKVSRSLAFLVRLRFSLACWVLRISYHLRSLSEFIPPHSFQYSLSFQMNGIAKPLPEPIRDIRDDKLPPPPPSDHDTFSSSVPPPPPKFLHDDLEHSNIIPHIDTSLAGSLESGTVHFLSPRPPLSIRELTPVASGLHVPPLTPMTPIGSNHSSVPPSPSVDGRPKKTNPLTDLIDTEKTYVDLLTGIIRVRPQ